MTLGGRPRRVPSHLLCARDAHRALPPAPTAAAPSLSRVPPLGLCTRPAPCWRAPLPGSPHPVWRSLLISPILFSLGTPSIQTRSGPASVLRGPESLHMESGWLHGRRDGSVQPTTVSAVPSPMLLDGGLPHLRGRSQQSFKGGMLSPLTDEKLRLCLLLFSSVKKSPWSQSPSHRRSWKGAPRVGREIRAPSDSLRVCLCSPWPDTFK